MRNTPTNIIKKMPIFKRFHSWAKGHKIKIMQHFTKVTKILNKARPKYSWKSKGRLINGKWMKNHVAIPRRIWEKTIKSIKLTKFWKYLYSWAVNKRHDVNDFFKIVRKTSFSKATHKIHWFTKFINWSKKQNIPIHTYINKVKSITRNTRLRYKFGQKKRIPHKYWRGIGVKKIPSKIWKGLIKRINNLPFYKFLILFSKKKARCR